MFCLLSWEGKKVWYWKFAHTILWKNHAENVHHQLVAGPFLILVKTQKAIACNKRREELFDEIKKP